MADAIYQTVMDVYSACKAAGIKSVSLAYSPNRRGPECQRKLIEMIIRSTGGTESLGGVALRVGTWPACSVIALVLLIRLWGTRYGDNNTLAKSFFLSLVLHGCFGLGWATVIESYPRRTGPRVRRDRN